MKIAIKQKVGTQPTLFCTEPFVPQTINNEMDNDPTRLYLNLPWFNLNWTDRGTCGIPSL